MLIGMHGPPATDMYLVNHLNQARRDVSRATLF